MKTNVSSLAGKIETLGVAARLHDLAFFMQDGEAARIKKIEAVLDHLDPGVYLAGAGPYTQGIYSLMCDEVVIGRLATTLEKPLDRPVDVFVNDNAALSPREVSRVHCSIYRRDAVTDHDYWLVDRGSSCGTYLNGERLPTPSASGSDDLKQDSRPLTVGDVISLGPSLVNCFVFVVVRR